MGRGAAAVLAAVALVGCDEDRQRIVVLDAAPELRDGQLCVVICDGDGALAKDECRPAPEVEWPARIPVTPRGDDPGRRFGVVATLATAGGAITVRIAGDFRGAARAEIPRTVDAACAGVVCPLHQTCAAGACEDLAVGDAALVAADAEAYFGCVPPPPPPGYTARACGFDLDDDGVIGEPDADCGICDGATTDPDGDGIDEDFVYVDCGRGADLADCGSPETPCLSIAHAFTRLNGPGGSEEDVICITGRCALTDRVTLPIPGVGGERAGEPSMPDNPLVIAGWDHDADGVYPPMDGEATLTGPVSAIALGPDAHHVEIAHLSFAGFGEDGTREARGTLVAVGTSSTHVHVHDVELQGISRNACPGDDSHRTFDLLGTDIVIDNVSCSDCGSNFAMVRGQRIRLAHVTHTALPASRGGTAPACTGAPAGFLTPIEIADATDVAIVDSSFDMNPTAWVPDTRSDAIFAFRVQRCSSNVLVARNELLDYRRFAIVGGDCATATGFVFEDNRYLTSYESGTSVFRLGLGTAEGMVLRRNHVETGVGDGASLGALSAVFEIDPGPATVAGLENEIVDNVAVVNLDGAPPIAWLSLSTLARPWTVRGNRIDSIGSAGAPNVLLGADVPAGLLDSDCNQFDSSLVFTTPTLAAGDLDAWRMETGLDVNSIACASLEACEPPCP